MVATRGEIKEWFLRGKKNNKTHLIVVCDTFDFENYPVYVSQEEDISAIESKYLWKNMQQVMEVYNLKKDMDKQLKMERSFNY
jgi:hypothetical protein